MKKIFKNSLFTLAATSSVVAPVATLVACGPSGDDTSELQFMNYEDYMVEDFQESIGEKFEYKQFGDLPEIKTGLSTKSVAGAIGSDYFNANLASQGKLTKIDFWRLYGSDVFIKNKNVEENLKLIYTPETFKILDAFPLVVRNSRGQMLDANNNVVTDIAQAKILDIDNDGLQDKLWEFMAPYFAQNKVIGVNLARLYNDAPSSEKEKLSKDNGQTFISQSEFDALISSKLSAQSKPATYKNILEIIRADFHANDITINDYMRDNLMIGSETADGTSIDNTPVDTTYSAHIKGFEDLVAPFGRKQWVTSGVDALTSIISDQKTSDVAILYNGDALYAHAGGGLQGNRDDGSNVRIIRPLNTTFMLDGLVIPSYMDEEGYSKDLELLYTKMRTTIFEGLNKNDSEIENTGVYKNFDSVNYTPVFSKLYNYVNANYFAGDDDGLAILKATEDGAKNFPTSEAFAKHVTGIIPNELEAAIATKYQSIK